MYFNTNMFCTIFQQVEEIYDLQAEKLVEDSDAYGFIFLFRWIEDRRARRKLIEEENLYCKNNVQSLFFAQQVRNLRACAKAKP